MKKKSGQNFILKDIKKLLIGQTATIIKEVDSRFITERGITDKKFGDARKETESLLSQQTIVILGAVDEKLEQTKKEFKQEINGLRISVDKFVGFYTKQDQEFTIMKEHMKRLEARLEKIEVKLA
ncbi:MAG: hypothetical protein HYT20_03220 [Candidatus Nealsonbacteria bacterium]|nr:hypothetical protein [Candidatus Nealsonbacteria bacterium]